MASVPARSGHARNPGRRRARSNRRNRRGPRGPIARDWPQIEADGLDEAVAQSRPRGCRAHRRLVAARLAILHHPKLLQPHPPHRVSQRRRPGRAFDRHHFSFAVPRRPDRRAHSKPFGAGTNHRRRDRCAATVETDSSITIDPDKLLDLRPGESYGPSEDALYGIDFPINPERVAPVLRRLVSPTKTRARIYDRDGVLLVDSRNLFGRGDVLRLRSAVAERRKARPVRARLISPCAAGSGRGDLPLYQRTRRAERHAVIPKWCRP